MRSTWRWILPLALVAACLPLAAQSDDDEEIRQSVARIAFVTGDVSYNRGDDPDAWDTASLNFPMTIGDRIWAAHDGRAELQARGASVFLASESELSVLNMTEDVRQLSLTQGTISARIHRLGDDDVFEIDTPNAAVTFDRAGSYRIDVDRDGNSRIVVRRGHAVVAAGGGQVPLESGDEMVVDGLDRPTYDVTAAGRMDGWDRWVEERARRWRTSRWSSSVSTDVIGYQDLDAYGRWDTIPGYGYSWTPSTVEVGWAPYRTGRWIWQDPWGWSWVAAEPWGFAPYHYGRWVNHSSRWWWVPAAPRIRVSYSPALVGFVGGGPGWSGSVGGGGFVGWFPLAPLDPFLPWWGRRSHGNVTNVTYVNRTYVTVVNQNTFVSGRVGVHNMVSDREVLRTVSAAPVLRGPIPVMPTSASIRFEGAAGARAVIRPPAPVLVRPVVTRLAPPPAPPTFAAKMDVIRENRGAPVSPVAASRIVVERPDRARAIVPVRPAAQDNVVLAPRRAEVSGPRPVAVTAPQGKVLATSDRPFVGAPGGGTVRTERNVVAQPTPAGATGHGGIREESRIDRAVERPTPVVRDERRAPPARIEREAPPPTRTTYERPTPMPRIEREQAPVRAIERPTPVVRDERRAPPARIEREAPPPTRTTYERPTPAPRIEREQAPARIERERPPMRAVEQAPKREEKKVAPPPKVEKKPEKKDEKKDERHN